MSRITSLTCITFILSCILLCSCSGKESVAKTEHKGPPRDSAPKVLTPSADGTVVYNNDYASLSLPGMVLTRYRCWKMWKATLTLSPYPRISMSQLKMNSCHFSIPINMYPLLPIQRRLSKGANWQRMLTAIWKSSRTSITMSSLSLIHI